MLRLLPHPLLLSTFRTRVTPSHSSLHIYAGGANADVGTTTLLQATTQVSADGPDRDSDLPFPSIMVSRVHAPTGTHASTHARRGTGADKRALHPSVFVVATSEEGRGMTEITCESGE